MNKKEKTDAAIQYAALISDQIISMFDEESNNHIELEELISDGEKLKSFLHALSNIVPCYIFNRWCNEDKNHLEWNHIANQLVFEFTEIEPDEVSEPQKEE